MAEINRIKHNFFSSSANQSAKLSFKETDFNLNQLKAEFSSLYQLFIANKHALKKEGEIVAYISCLCNLMIDYYKLDYVEDDLHALLEKKNEIERFIKETTSEETKPLTVLSKVRKGASNFATVVMSSAKLREDASFLITNRSYWNYSRTLASYLIIYLQENGFAAFMEAINEKIGSPYNLQDFVRLLDKPQRILRVSSVALYTLRFMINLTVMIKHVVKAALNKELSSQKVLIQEMEKRGYSMANDMVWGTVNLLSNYNRVFQLSSLVIAQINLAFLTFDLALFIVRWSVERRDYINRVNDLMRQKNEVVSSLELAVINRQIDIVNDEWEAQCAYYKFNIVAATLFIGAFGSTFVFFGPFALGILAGLSMLGNALYNTASEYKKYKQSSIAVQREITNGKFLANEHHYEMLNALNYRCAESYKLFWKTLIFNTTATAFIITAAAISWPIACALTFSYLSYRLYENYQKSREGEENKLPSNDIYRLFTVESSSNSAKSALPSITLC
ncbi:hypothetical protein [Legionella hackeliae]|uniref:Putative membrane protein n=1 Tax=Legionella hackeliae TaxID=449 RepID=A0A0A8UNF3_LEGHA|nr:hypothetical protein [Legionella hackeliae]KTD14197.1 coiled-coil protein [Legionella hackeliae]CEK10405.1 putative membrane protein [Legionella hackeliae]STX47142.1 coiled-coil protein [Legionella hackeliae]